MISAFPLVEPYRVPLAVGFVLLIMLVNLRGVKESGITFAIPTYFFLVMMYINVIAGFIKLIAGTIGYETLNGRFKLGSLTRRTNKLMRLSKYMITDP